MSNASLKWGLGLVLLGMLADTVTPHPLLEVKNEYQYEGLIPQPVVLGFANERQWLFAHREFRNQCGKTFAVCVRPIGRRYLSH